MDVQIVLNRTDEARLKVLRSIDRNIDTLTVGQICERVGISKRTFYRLFSSKHDIWMWYSGIADNLFLSRIGYGMGWEEAYGHFFAFLSRELEHQRYAAGNTLDQAIVQEKINVRKAAMEKSIAALGHARLDPSLSLQVDVWLWTEMAFVFHVCKSDRPLPDDLAGCLLPFLPSQLRRALVP